MSAAVASGEGASRVLSDTAVPFDADLLAFQRYVDPLIDVLTSPVTATPLTIGVFGTWGSGKSTLLRMLDERLASQHGDGFVRVHFNPWVHRREPDLLMPLLLALHEALEADRRERFKEAGRKVWSIAKRLAADVLLKRLSGDSVSLERIEELGDRYASERGKVESETRRLRETLQSEADAIAAEGARLVVFIDDLDRCEPGEVIDVLESVKLFLDVRHVFVVLAVDKEVIDRGIEVKYADFPFAKDRQAAIGSEYMEKMVQLPLYLHPLPPDSVGDFLAALDLPQPIGDQIDLLKRIALPNPRKLKRIVNILSLTTAIIDATPALDELDRAVVARLVVLQVQSNELYAASEQHVELLPALESVYAGDRKVEKPEHFASFGRHRDVIRGLAERFYRPEDPYLRRLFEDEAFAAADEQLPTYLSMLGRT